ncbi:MAG TPA: ABC transporter substrate-binding protein, partial [Dehalococcoidia bacterium]|nr:ABC transporter substrate-binding protein [Dehalococcoidia bacterium]
MWYIRSAQIRKVTLGILLIGLFFLVACGQAAPATPEPTEAPATDVGGTGAEATDTPVPDVEPTQPPAGDSKPAAGRLAVAMSPPVHELVLAWMGTTSDANLNARHFVEPLVETDNQTGELVSGLATDWEMTSPDGKTWTFKLKEGVPFHNGFGEFSAQDVPHTLAMNTQDEAIGTDTSLLRDLLGETEEEMRQNVETPDDQTVVFNLLEPRSDMGFIASAQQGNMLMYSKAQWDQEGEEGYNSQPAGTGSWQLVGRQLG